MEILCKGQGKKTLLTPDFFSILADDRDLVVLYHFLEKVLLTTEVLFTFSKNVLQTLKYFLLF
jgi:hypothetical protein